MKTMNHIGMRSVTFAALLGIGVIAAGSLLAGQAGQNPDAPVDAKTWTAAVDHQHMMDQLKITKLRPGKSGNNQTGPGFELASANAMMPTLPDVLVFKNGTKVTTPEQWTRRRAEILEDFEREVYGRIPANVPKVTWTVTTTTTGTTGDVPTLTKVLQGAVDNSAYPEVTVNIRATFTVPVNTPGPVPVMIQFGGVGGARGGAAGGPAAGPAAGSWQQIAIQHGWGYGAIDPGSIQADAGGFALRQGIIGLTNKGQPRTPDQWGALRAWQWGVSRLIDYFEANPDSKVDPKKVATDGVSRYGKASIVTEAFEPRLAVALVASSGEGGVKLHRHDFGEALENLTAGEYYWMAGNILKYGASEAAGGAKTAADLPVDSHQLIALCAPRPVFISYGIEPGDPKWVDAPGSFMAAVLAGPVYKLLGKKDLGTPGNPLTDPMPAVNQLIGGDLAWRQHSGGHTEQPNWPTFFDWVGNYIKSPAAPAAAASK